MPRRAIRRSGGYEGTEGGAKSLTNSEPGRGHTAAGPMAAGGNSMTRSGLATVMLGGHLTLAVWVGGRLRALAEAASELGLAADSVPSTMRAALADWDRWCDVAAEAAAGAASREGWVDEETVEFCPAITDPPNVYCAGANYHDHVQEMGGKA